MISKSKVVENLEPGDLIEIFRPGFQHWAVYVGEGDVVDLVTLEISAIISEVPGEVRKIKLQDVVNKDNWQKNNITHPNYDTSLKPRPKQKIVNEALSHVGKNVKYTAAFWNCEHFATKCRYGTALSLQVIKTFEKFVEVGAGFLSSLAASASRASHSS
ncbi:phospholipase A and acyltransferase 1-like [Scomber scombrus]|uniref:phospholipase A and acyltransferase 1-like n=1 Tax=Scomber scombrus TaxID=13677 RepID=UPI002DD9FE93|nr:phospholipase A and acyltransferase 1-like [Scomber scombrus]